MTTATVTRANSYIATDSTVALDKVFVRRGNTYLVATPIDAPLERVFVRRENTYLVATPIDAPLERVFVRRENTYLVGMPDISGAARQPVDELTPPTYRAGPKPYIEHGVGGSLEVYIPQNLGGSWTWIAYLPNGTFDEQTLVFQGGAYNTLPAVDFNQAFLVPQTIDSTTTSRVKYTMVKRSTPISTTFRGARLKNSVDFTVLGGGNRTVPWDTVLFDTDNFFDPLNPTYFTIPAGVSYVECTYSLVATTAFSSTTDIQSNFVQVFASSGSSSTIYLQLQDNPNLGGLPTVSCSGPIPVSEGDRLYPTWYPINANFPANSSASFFAIRVLQ